MWDLIASVTDHCLSFYFPLFETTSQHSIFDRNLQPRRIDEHFDI